MSITPRSTLFSLYFAGLVAALGNCPSVIAQSPEASDVAAAVVVTADSSPSLTAQLESLCKQYHAASLAVVVIKDGLPAYSASLGKRDREQAIDLLPTDLFRIASISKSFCSTAIMQLAEQGKLSLDTDVSELIGFTIRNPSFPDTPITLKMLLSHTSSLNDSAGYFRLDVIDPNHPDSSVRCYSSEAPGTHYRYCNLNFNLAGAIVERVSGQRFDQYVDQHVLQPLRLVGGYHVNDLNSVNYVKLYEFDTESQQLTAADYSYRLRDGALDDYRLGYSTPQFSPTGGMKISAPHLARYMTMHMRQGEIDGVRILSPESTALMQSIVAPGGQYGLALGHQRQLIPGETLVGHTGSAYGLYSMMFFHPEKQYGFVAITSGSDGRRSEGAVDFLQQVVRLLHQEVIVGVAD